MSKVERAISEVSKGSDSSGLERQNGEVEEETDVRLNISEYNVSEILVVGASGPCRWRDGEWHDAEIVETRSQYKTGLHECYVHYKGFNRRLDEWVLPDRFDIEKIIKPSVSVVKRSVNIVAQNKDQAEIKDEQQMNEKNEKGMTRKSLKKRKFSGEELNENVNKDGNENGNLTKAQEKTERKSVTEEKEEKQHEEAHKVKNIQTIVIGKYEMDAWYYSPFPAEYANCTTLYFCEFCLKFHRSNDALKRHSKRCILKHPPGNEIYRKGNVSMWELDGEVMRIYCQNLCYLAKLFLDHKTLFYDVDVFWFYVMTESDENGCHLVGYFSKEKFSEEDYNVACILTLPSYQRKGYGKFLISFSYELSKLENKVGSPEKPLSDLGLLGYRSYWSQLLIDLLKNESDSGSSGGLSIQQISERTMMKTEDIISTLQALGLIQYYEGQHIIDLRRVANMKMGSRGLPCDPKCIRWTPKNSGNLPLSSPRRR